MASFGLATLPVTSNDAVTITGTLNQISGSATLTLTPIFVSGLSLSPTSLYGGSTLTGTVTLNANAPTGGLVISLAASDPQNAPLGKSVSILAGAKTATFTLTPKQVGANEQVTVMATLNSKSVGRTFTILAFKVTSTVLAPTSVVGGSKTTVTFTVSLNAPAPTGGIVVALASSSSAIASIAPTGTIPAGSSTAAFVVTTYAVKAATFANLTATLNGLHSSARLNVTPN
jgi:hypothetical protein